ncbi:WD40 repeat-like protein, partial [Metschnikowia bicuspidata var. bicuspidata NRRL YB-4993]
MLAPKYIKATRKNNRSPKVLNHLFLAQELRCSSVTDLKFHAEHGADAGADARSDTGSPEPGADSKAPANLHEILAMEFSRDGKYLAAAGRDSRIRVWQVIASPLSRLKYKNFESAHDEGGGRQKQKAYAGAPVFLQEPVRVFEGHHNSVLCLDWSKNNFLLSGSMDKTVKLWNIERDECLETFRHCDFVTALRFHPTDDRFFVSGALDNRLRLWLILEHSVAYMNDLGDNALITALEFTPLGNYCVAGGFNGLLFALETQGLLLVKRIEVTRRPSNAGHSAHSTTISGIKVFENPTCADVPSLALTKWNLLITTSDSTVRLVDLSLRKLVTRFKGNSNHSSSIVASLSEDCRYIVCGSEDHWCYVWENNNAVINSKLRSSIKEMLLDGRNQLDEKHKRISRLLHDNMLWKKLPMQMFLKDENGKKYIANNNYSYSAFHAHSSRVNVALFAPEKSKRLLQFADDKIFDLVKRGTLLTGTQGSELTGEPPWGSDHIIVTADVTGLIRVFRQDPAHHIRKNLLELAK